jgi:hypothetical protein
MNEWMAVKRKMSMYVWTQMYTRKINTNKIKSSQKKEAEKTNS